METMTTEVNKTPKREIWPIAIGAVLVLFILGVISVAVFSTTQRHDLVVRDYYDAGLEYQRQVDSANRAGEGGEPFFLTRLAAPRGIRLTFAERFMNQPLEGKVTLYRPSNSGYDRTADLALDGKGQQVLPMDRLPSGLWKVKVVWTQGGEEYYHETSFVMQ